MIESVPIGEVAAPFHFCTTTVEVDEGGDWPTERPCLEPAVFVVMSEFMNDAQYVCRNHVTAHVPVGGTLFVMYTWQEEWAASQYDPSLT
jgi:hypothetical protein